MAALASSGQVVFWCLFVAVLYVYVGYPLAVFLLAGVCRRRVRTGPCEPRVSILIAAHNEEVCIARTIENKLALDYPREKLEVIVVSDGSTDRTEEIVRRYASRGVKLLRQVPRYGKTAALNQAVSRAAGEVLVFSDANSMYEHDALRRLVENFHDPTVGYVTGKLMYVTPDGATIGNGCSLYMKYENFLRLQETQIGSIVGVDGGIDAIRRSLYRTMKSDQIPDFILPLRVVEQDYRVVYEPRAIQSEEAHTSSEGEYRMRVRVSLRSLWALKDMKHLLNVARYGLFSWQLLSHKVLRYQAFAMLMLMYAVNAALWTAGPLYQATLLLQTVVYALGYLGYRLDRRGRPTKYLMLPYYFALINVASGHAFLKFLTGRKQVIWIPRAG
jgi:cellulose synthase/poly-beta-1,6-N-acetylglucosamine synthase-like glycosyltransferase